MGNTLGGTGEKSAKEFEPIIEKCYEKYVDEKEKVEAGNKEKAEELGLADFYHLVCETVEEINKKLGNTQFCVPKVSTLDHVYLTHHQGKGKSLTKEEFQTIMQEVIVDTGVTGFGAKDIFFYLFGVPVTALFIKQRVAPDAVPNEIFIPGITSLTVFVLAKINKI
ncbi:uncharacterized protein LOC104444162 [Eucalyptus grandis]|uniref:Uncharacterized protein n=2 Tax=Eucalyptus grandis TaxID=71139 RepID=A0ACC3M729_EUCGR|nr:uncharacterized protein LOC104444162 [Eucalyptus grandis]KAK3446562.1 hypothetical protein EUGRSUZ_A02247 [Eucalyptus grandis]